MSYEVSEEKPEPRESVYHGSNRQLRSKRGFLEHILFHKFEMQYENIFNSQLL